MSSGLILFSSFSLSKLELLTVYVRFKIACFIVFLYAKVKFKFFADSSFSDNKASENFNNNIPSVVTCPETVISIFSLCLSNFLVLLKLKTELNILSSTFLPSICFR